jgi:hypothetical protein
VANNHYENHRFLAAMAALGEAVSQDLPDTKLKIYAKALEDIPVNDIERACWHLIRTRTTATFPKVAEIREAIHGKAADKAVLAMLTIEKATATGPYNSIVFDDPYIHATIHALGGWENVCDISTRPDEWKFFKKEIEKTYTAILDRPLTPDVPLRLAGFTERVNSARGLDLAEKKNRPKVDYIGDARKIEEWRDSIKQLTGRIDSLKQIGNEPGRNDVKSLLDGIGG